MRGDPEVREGSVVIAGKCDLVPVRVGDRFTRLVDAAGQPHVVNLGVVDIRLYGHYVLELDVGMAGELFLVGEVELDLLVSSSLYGRDGASGRVRFDDDDSIGAVPEAGPCVKE